MNIDNFNKLMAKAEDDLKIPDNLDLQKLINLSVAVSSKYQRWLGIFTTVYHEYDNLCLELEKLRGEELQGIRFGKPDKYPAAEYGWKTKDEIESQYYQNPVLYDKMAQKNLLKAQVTYLEKTLDAIKTMGYQIKNIVEIKKLNFGGI